MGNGKQNILQMPGQEPRPVVLREDQRNKLKGKMVAAVLDYLEGMQIAGISRQDVIEKAVNTVTLIINLLSLTSDAVSVCSAARIIHDRMELIRKSLLPPIVAEIPDFTTQEQGLVDVLISDTGVVLEIYTEVLDEDQMKPIIAQLKGDESES